MPMKKKIIQWVEILIVMAALVGCYYWYAQYRAQRDDFDKVTRNLNRRWQQRLDSAIRYQEDRYKALEAKKGKHVSNISKSKERVKDYEKVINNIDSVGRDSLWRAAGFR